MADFEFASANKLIWIKNKTKEKHGSGTLSGLAQKSSLALFKLSCIFPSDLWLLFVLLISHKRFH